MTSLRDSSSLRGTSPDVTRDWSEWH